LPQDDQRDVHPFLVRDEPPVESPTPQFALKDPSRGQVLVSAAVIASIIIWTLVSVFHGGGKSQQAQGASTAQTASATAEPTDSPTQEPKPKLKPRPVDHHEEREVAQKYWSAVLVQAVMIEAAQYNLKQSIGHDDLVEASRYAMQARDTARVTAGQIGRNVPPGWQDVEEQTAASMQHFVRAYAAVTDAIDSEKPSDMAAAIEASDTANSEIEKAVHLARLHYVAMGGKWSDIAAP